MYTEAPASVKNYVMTDYKEFFEANKELWNKRTAVHKDSAFYDVAFFKQGKNMLTPIELKELGDVKGKKMLHLQCHFGLDSLCWARMGADVTGVDLSDAAIEEAKRINDEMGLDAKFICSNVYDLKENLAGAFDIVFTSYGVIGWLPDLDNWASIIAHYLKPSGTFYMAEFHPVVWMFNDEFTKIEYAYENKEVIVIDNAGTYTDREADISGKEYSWNHSLSEVLNALIKQGLQIQLFNEFMYSPYPNFSNSVEVKPGQWHIRGMEGKMPMIFSVKAIKP